MRRLRDRWGWTNMRFGEWDGWYRHITLAMLAHAYLAVSRQEAMDQGCSMARGAIPAGDERLIPITVPEVRRLLTRLVWTVNLPVELVLSLSMWRRRHQTQARRCHVPTTAYHYWHQNCNCRTIFESKQFAETISFRVRQDLPQPCHSRKGPRLSSFVGSRKIKNGTYGHW